MNARLGPGKPARNPVPFRPSPAASPDLWGPPDGAGPGEYPSPMPRPARTDDLNHETFPATSTTDPAVTRAFALAAAQSLADDKCEDVIVLDVRELSQVTDFIVIGTGTSDRQMHSALSSIEVIGRAQGFPVFRSSDDDRATWLLADFVDVVVHVFEPNTRAHYDLEMLWGDALRVPWTRSEPRPRRSRSSLKEGGAAS